MILSRSSIYGLRASVLLAAKRETGFTNIRELSDELDLSFYFLTKVLQRLTAAGIVESCKGPKGGVRLKEHPDDISFMDIIVAIEGELNLHECVLGLNNCGNASPCRFHGKWSGLKKEILELLRETRLININKTSREFPDAQTVADLIRKKI